MHNPDAPLDLVYNRAILNNMREAVRYIIDHGRLMNVNEYETMIRDPVVSNVFEALGRRRHFADPDTSFNTMVNVRTALNGQSPYSAALMQTWTRSFDDQYYGFTPNHVEHLLPPRALSGTRRLINTVRNLFKDMNDGKAEGYWSDVSKTVNKPTDAAQSVKAEAPIKQRAARAT